MTDITKIENPTKPITVVSKINELVDTTNNKQDTLVSGTNIKTINNTSILGSGNISISSGTTYTPGDGIDITNNVISVDGETVIELTLATVATSGSYNDLSNKPTIPSEVTESTVSGWGFTKNTGTVTSVNNVSPVNGNVTLSIPTITDTYSATSSNGMSGKAVASAISVKADSSALSDYVPTSRTVNGKALSSNISLTASDVGALADSTVIPTVNDATLTIQKNSTDVATFTANASSNVTANISVPTKTSDLTNDDGFITGITSSDVTTALGYTPYSSSNPNGYTSNTGTVTSVNNVSPVSGNVTLSIPIVDQSYSGTSTNAQSGVAVKSAIDSAISSVYKAAGSVAYASLPTPTSTNEGYVYNVTDAFTTDSRFVEGSGKSYPAGTNVVIINTGSSTYKFDVLAGMVDLSGYVPTSRTVNGKALSSNISLSASDVGALADSTTIPTITDTYSATSSDGMSGKAVANAISGKADSSALSDYVAKSGGNAQQTISLTSGTGTTPFGVKSMSNSSYISFSGSSSWLASLGINSSKKPVVYDGDSHTIAYTTDIPTKVSQLTNDSGFTTNTGTVTSVNNVSPVDGNVTLSIPTVNNATLTIQKNGTTVNTFTANASSNVTANITVPTVSYDSTTETLTIS